LKVAKKIGLPEAAMKTDLGTPDVLSRREAAAFLGICKLVSFFGP
jgi:hypothetical protein